MNGWPTGARVVRFCITERTWNRIPLNFIQYFHPGKAGEYTSNYYQEDSTQRSYFENIMVQVYLMRKLGFEVITTVTY